MKPDWRKVRMGILVVFLCYIVYVALSIKFKLPATLHRLPKDQVLWGAQVLMIPITVLFAILGFRLAKKKGRNPMKWMFACFFFNVWAFIYLWALPDLKASNEGETAF